MVENEKGLRFTVQIDNDLKDIEERHSRLFEGKEIEYSQMDKLVA